LPEPLVKVPTTLATSDVDDQSIEHQTLLFIFVEAQVEKLAQVPPTLRRPEGIGMLDTACAGVALLGNTIAQKGCDIPRGQ
jgi:hypothetical protein